MTEKKLDDMTISELLDYAGDNPGYALCQYISKRRAIERGLPEPTNEPYDSKYWWGVGVQGPR